MNKIMKNLIKIVEDKKDYFDIEKVDLKSMGEDGRKLLRLFLEKDNEIKNLKSKINFISENIFNNIDSLENEVDIEFIKKFEKYKRSLDLLFEILFSWSK